MRNLRWILLALAAAGAEDDPWARVRELARGVELRVWRTGEKQPLAARFDALSEESLVVIRRDGQAAIPRDGIERVECRAADTGSRVAAEAHRVVGTSEEARLGRSKATALPPNSTSGGIRIHPRRGFETVYRRR
jgi:hypothetical protein